MSQYTIAIYADDTMFRGYQKVNKLTELYPESNRILE